MHQNLFIRLRSRLGFSMAHLRHGIKFYSLPRAAALASWWLVSCAGLKSTASSDGPPAFPRWYPSMRKVVWFALVVVLTVCGVPNTVYGIQQSGLVSRTMLFWPANAAIYWMLSTGFAMCVATLLWWHVASAESIGALAYMILVGAVVSTVSLLSAECLFEQDASKWYLLLSDFVLSCGICRVDVGLPIAGQYT